jgi:hypothetical protein
MHQLLVTANVPCSPILVTLMMEVVRSPETSVLTRTTWHNIPEDGTLHINLIDGKFYWGVLFSQISLYALNNCESLFFALKCTH